MEQPRDLAVPEQLFRRAFHAAVPDHGAAGGDVTAICPHCGFNLRADQPVSAGPYSYDPRAGVSFEEQPLPIKKKAHEIVASLMLARGRVLSRDVLTQRVSVHSTSNTVDAHLSMARAALRDRGIVLPIENVHGLGWRWTGPAVVAQAGA